VEIRINLALIAAIGLLWLGLRVHAPERIEISGDALQLAELEDGFARDRAHKQTLVALTGAYIEAGFPQLAVMALRKAEPALMEEPSVAHQLARAYEQSGRLLDALATADLALARCARVIGAEPLDTAVPSFSCNERTFAKLEMHKGALERMVRWGIVDPRLDPRAQHAYDVALRRARVAAGELPRGASIP